SSVKRFTQISGKTAMKLATAPTEANATSPAIQQILRARAMRFAPTAMPTIATEAIPTAKAIDVSINSTPAPMPAGENLGAETRQHVGEDADGQNRLQRREAGDGADLEDVDEHRHANPEAADLRNDARAAREQIPGHHRDADDVGGQRTGGDTAHAELRDRAEAQPQRAAKNDLADGRRQHHER